MQRRKLLMYISYLGTNYQGLQLVKPRIVSVNKGIRTVPEYGTVQGVLELALRTVLNRNEVIIHTSSRTDSGVHAQSSTLQFEIATDVYNIPFCPERICQLLNYYLEGNQTEIRIQKVVEVPTDFNCRRAYSRTYTYRIAVLKSNDFANCYSLIKLSPILPIHELNKVQVVTQPFDVETVQQACRIFVGTWNFRSFASLTKPQVKPNSKNQDVITVEDLTKTIYKFSFAKSQLDKEDSYEDVEDLNVSTYYFRNPAYTKIDFYDFHIEGSGFLRRQVRRMVGLLLSIGRGLHNSSEILRLLNDPSEKSWPNNVNSAIADGLSLKSVNYKNLNILRGPLS